MRQFHGTSGSQAFPLHQDMMRLRKDTPSFLRTYRQHAWEVYHQLPLPTTREEAWRRTDLRNMDVARFRFNGISRRLPKIPSILLRPSQVKHESGRLALSSDGSVQRVFSEELNQQGVVFTDLLTAEEEYPQLLEQVLGKIVRPEESKFAAMSAAFAQNGVFIYIPRGVQVEQHLHSVLWAGSEEREATCSHSIIWVDEGASLTYVHESISPKHKNGQNLHAGTVEIIVGQAASLRLVEVQSWGPQMWNFSHARAEVQQDGQLDWNIAAIGSHLSKSFASVDLSQPGGTARMAGLYFTDGIQHIDIDTQQNHLAPHTTSDLLFKGALKGQSHAVWRGKIYVAPQAQRTDGYQANRNLVLSPQARVDSIPGLEILANDVRCTHGATVGKLDPEQLFFLQARGIPLPEARRLIVEGFFEAVIQRIPEEEIRYQLQRIILQKMH